MVSNKCLGENCLKAGILLGILILFSLNVTATLEEDTTDPIIDIRNIEDGETYTSHITSLVYQVNDENLESCKYSTDNGLTQTSVDCSRFPNTISNLNSIEGTNIWKIYAVDSYGNQAIKSVTFIVDISEEEPGEPEEPEEDTTPPEINIISPISGVIYNTYYVRSIVYEIIDENLESCKYSIDNGLTWIDMNCYDSPIYGLQAEEGTNIWKIYAVDSYGNQAIKSVTFTFNTPPDISPPSVFILSPEEGANYDTSEILLRVSSNEALSIIRYSIDNGITKLPLSRVSSLEFIKTITFPDGIYTINFYATDEAGNTNEGQVIFTINTGEEPEEPEEDTTPPEINIISPISGANYNHSDITFEITTNELSTAWFNLDGSNNINMIDLNNLGINFYYDLTLSDGTYTVIFYTQDQSGNIAQSNQIPFTINTSEPSSSSNDDETSSRRSSKKETVYDQYFRGLYEDSFEEDEDTIQEYDQNVIKVYLEDKPRLSFLQRIFYFLKNLFWN